MSTLINIKYHECVFAKPSQAKPSQAKPSQAKPSQAKELTEGVDLREGQVDVPLSVRHSRV